ncbi:hypothetical protein CYMTET_54659 [Cymbomonas tetramitiformis]|uniref:Uncharacterized protein n=1 Tax=Cymbomonas tetramitiformis TaxID=36881 RepID=A0AAE0BGA4_9CHLO|nr:hypothetical protein CYMTET_54659 [Cymbomonas tetramitiformis]
MKIRSLNSEQSVDTSDTKGFKEIVRSKQRLQGGPLANLNGRRSRRSSQGEDSHTKLKADTSVQQAVGIRSEEDDGQVVDVRSARHHHEAVDVGSAEDERQATDVRSEEKPVAQNFSSVEVETWLREPTPDPPQRERSAHGTHESTSPQQEEQTTPLEPLGSNLQLVETEKKVQVVQPKTLPVGVGKKVMAPRFQPKIGSASEGTTAWEDWVSNLTKAANGNPASLFKATPDEPDADTKNSSQASEAQSLVGSPGEPAPARPLSVVPSEGAAWDTTAFLGGRFDRTQPVTALTVAETQQLSGDVRKQQAHSTPPFPGGGRSPPAAASPLQRSRAPKGSVVESRAALLATLEEELLQPTPHPIRGRGAGAIGAAGWGGGRKNLRDFSILNAAALVFCSEFGNSSAGVLVHFSDRVLFCAALCISRVALHCLKHID